MKLKGISFFEAHFEKVLVGIMLVVFLTVLVYQFVLQTNQVTVDGRAMPLGRAFEPATAAAERLLAEMDNPSPALPEVDATEDLAEGFRSRLNDGVWPTGSEAPSGVGNGIETSWFGETGEVAGNLFAAFEPPAPAKPLVAVYRAALDPYALADVEGIEAILPEEQPFDTLWLSVQTSFDGTALQAAFERDPDGPGGEVQPLRSDWWRPKASVLSVEVERELRQADGSWGGATIVASLPGDEPVVPLDETPANWRALDDLSFAAGRAEDLVLRPPFLPVLEGPAWVPPSEVPEPGDLASNEQQIRVLERRLASIERDITRRSEASTGGGRQTGGGDAGRPDVGRPSDAGPSGGSGSDDTRRSAIERQIERLEEQADAVREQLQELGWQDDQADELAPAFDPSDWRPEGDPLSSEEIALWAHDPFVEEGAAYRYRVRLVYANPLFGRQATLADELDPLANEAFVRSSWSEWSDTVSAGWSEYFFVERASRGNDFSGPTARAELYRFFYGYWRVASVSLAPGDRFVGEIDLPEGLQVWDPDATASAQAWQPGDDAEQPAGLELMPETLMVEADAWLLDVITSPFQQDGLLGATAAAGVDVLLRGPDGMVSRRIPDREKSRPVYRVIRASALAGQEQIPSIPGQGPRRIERPGPGDGRNPVPSDIDPRDPRFNPPRPPPDGGGGGGG